MDAGAVDDEQHVPAGDTHGGRGGHRGESVRGCVVLRVTILSSKLTVWVAEPDRISTAVLAVSGLVIVKLAPLLAWEGAEVIVGRVPWDRYGGEKISSVLPPPPAPVSPAEKTRPSGSRTAEEW